MLLSLLQALGDALLDEHNVAQTARPGTSLMRPATGTATVRELSTYPSLLSDDGNGIMQNRLQTKA